jgi:hypothetical protein
VFRRLARTIGLLAALGWAVVPPVAHAQTNIDQGKSPAEIFANDCATCHKSARGLANGKNSLMLSSFLREHYTASRDQAAALAAYVLGAGGGDNSTAAQAHTPKPGTDHAKATGEEPKTTESKTTEPKTAARPTRQPADEEAKPDDQGSPVTEPSPAVPGQRPTAGGHEVKPVTTTRGHKKGLETAPFPQEPAAVSAVPASNQTPSTIAPSPAEAPSQDMSPTTSAAVPPDSQPSDSAPVPRDNIPD